jgi:hypothetical protein
MIRARLLEQEIREAIGVPGEGELVVDGVAALDEEEDRSLYWFAAELRAGAREALARRSECIVIAPAGSSAGGLGGCRMLQVPDPRAALAKVLVSFERSAANRRWSRLARSRPTPRSRSTPGSRGRSGSEAS